MLARAALACALLLGMATGARADRRPVAVVNLDTGKDSPAIAPIRLLNGELEENPRLQRVPSSNDETALRDYRAPEDTELLEESRLALLKTRAYLEAYDIKNAIQTASNELTNVGALSPTAAIGPYADLVFELGVAKLGAGRPDEANGQMVFARRLAPDLKLADDLLPEIVSAYTHARPPKGRGTVEVHGIGRVWVDGAEVGDAPGSFEEDAGPHLVQLTGPERHPRGMRVDVDPKTPVVADIADAPLSREQVLYRARAAIVTAPDAMARIAAIRKLAQLVGVHDIVFLDVATEANGKRRVTEQTWQDTAGFTAVQAPVPPRELLDTLAPPPAEAPPDVPQPPITRPILPDGPPWYRQTTYQLGIGVGVLAAIVTGIVYASREGTIGFDRTPGFK